MDTNIPKYGIDWTTTSLRRLSSLSAMLETRVPWMKICIDYQPTRVTALPCPVLRVPPILSAKTKKKELKTATVNCTKPPLLDTTPASSSSAKIRLHDDRSLIYTSSGK
ncbi:hypothetical protein JG688_00014728 [Phytophthora aleatoria]|uniref:Uncharacterized protein n=1 Tax=Phytophthora aleatoria TaxID=2496075 RepID=A0A8J5M349_9STRA|nr:hypothetical protein JG688_00014728 [Phytophthora aleatoria]